MRAEQVFNVPHETSGQKMGLILMHGRLTRSSTRTLTLYECLNYSGQPAASPKLTLAVLIGPDLANGRARPRSVYVGAAVQGEGNLGNRSADGRARLAKW